MVGGAVRDALLGRPASDWDVATSASTALIRKLFGEYRPFTLKHATVSLVHGGRLFEVTPFRGAGRSLRQDLAARDFTLNALAWTPRGNRVLDPWGGRADIAGGLIRATVSPADRLREDPLRLLRAIRLAAELRFRIEPGTLAAISKSASLIHGVAPERVRDELLRLLAAPKPSLGFKPMLKTGLLSLVLPEIAEGLRKRQGYPHRYTIYRHVMETVDRVPPESRLRLSALLHDVAKPRVRTRANGRWRFYGHAEAGARMAEEILDRLRFSRSLTREVVHLVRHHMILYDPRWTDSAVRRLIRRTGRDHLPGLLALRRADLAAQGPESGRAIGMLHELEERIQAQIKANAATRLSELAIGGREVMQTLGIPPGPRVGRILNELLAEILKRPELNRRELLLTLLRRSPNRA